MLTSLLILTVACRQPEAPAGDTSGRGDATGGGATPDGAAPSDTGRGDTAPADTGPAALVPALTADVSGGPLPLTVRFDGSASLAEAGLAEVSWRFGDEEVSGEDGGSDGALTAAHTYLWSGDWTATLTLTDAAGQVASASITLAVEPPSCPPVGEPRELGTVESAALTEASGVVESRRSPGVLWSHNDSGSGAALFAMSTDGQLLGTWTLEGAERGDPEDLSVLVEDGVSVLYLGAIGDNERDREAVWIYRIVEPEVPTPGSGEPVEETVSVEVITVSYPDGVAYDAESLLGDPLTGDLLIVTKDYTGPAEVFRKPAPHVDGEVAVLEHVASLNFSEEPLFGGATTGAAVSPDGGEVLIRTYFPTAYLWIRDGSVPLWEAIRGEPCEVPLPLERQGESVAFAADGSGLFTISEGEHQPIWFTPL